MGDKIPLPLLENVKDYTPDTIDLNANIDASQFWFPCLRNTIAKFAKQARLSQQGGKDTSEHRAVQFETAYLNQLANYEDRTQSPNTNAIGICELFLLSIMELRKHGFPDPWCEQKRNENAAAINGLHRRLEQIDSIKDFEQRWTELVKGVLAGNMFDWGAEAITNIMEHDSDFNLDAALNKIQKRPWLIDDLDGWIQRLRCGPKHKCALIFVDNSGADVVLGVLPFVRELLKGGTKVLLCANANPALNDVTYSELRTLMTEHLTSICSVLSEALSKGNLEIHSNGQSGPCLDMRTLPSELCNAIVKNETDLIVIEGMGRALHTNLYAKFTCESLKLAVVKNDWLANYLGGKIFSVICQYENDVNKS